MDKALMGALSAADVAGNVQMVEMSREEARELAVTVDHDDLVIALDEMQGSADAVGRTSFVVIKINGAPL